MKYLKVEDPNNLYYIDIETDSLEPKVIHCCVIKNKGTQKYFYFYKETLYGLKEFILSRPDAVWSGHNCLSFDGPSIARLCDLTFPLDSIVDTLVLSYLYNPSLYNGHSLESYGERLNYPKGKFSDWSHFTFEMLQYCKRDVDLQEKVHDALLKRMNALGFSEESCSIEHNFRHIIDKQIRNGIYFDTNRAKSLLSDLRKRQSDLAEQVHKLFPPTLEKVGKDRKLRCKDSSYTLSYEKNISDVNNIITTYEEENRYETHRYKEFNLSSPTQRLQKVLDLGYKPTSFTPKGNPKIDEDSLVAFSNTSGIQELKAIANYLVCFGRANMVESWLGFVKGDERIHGEVFTCAANSRRCTHNHPNTANIPSAQNGAQYGGECRALWGISPLYPDHVMVGYDAKGLETHVMCHFLESEKANELLLKGDVHESNRKAIQSSLDAHLGQGAITVVRGGGGAKTAMYAIIYGAYPKRIGSIFKLGPKEGAIIQEVILSNVPGLQKAISRAKTEWKRRGGLIRTMDGGFVRCPSESAAFNYQIQPNGAILMKKTAILLDKRLRDMKLWHLKLLDVHDEGQHETHRENAELLGKTAVQSITDAGEYLGFNVRMTGDFRIGKSWDQTH